MEKQKIYDVHQLWTIYKSHKKWFLYSLLVCLCLGLSYIYWTRPLYSVTGKVQIIDRKGTNTVSASSLLQNQLPFGLGSSLGGSVSMETEKEILKSRLIARDAVEELGLYTEYRVRKWLRSRMLYKNSPILVTVSENILKQMDESLPMMSYSIKLSIDKDDDGYRINGCVVENKDEKELPEIVSASLPASVNTSLGALKLAENNDLTDKDRKRFAKGYHLDVTIVPPMNKARMLAKKMSVSSPSKKSSSIQFNDENILRGIDYVNAIVENYNRQSNEEKHQEAAKNDEFVNERMVKIDAELNSVDARLEASKRKYQVTEPKVDAEEVMKKKSAYENQIVNIGIQQQMLDYLGEYVNDPANLYELIPMNVIGNTRDSIPLISRHNQLVNERKKMLSSMTEQTVQVRQNKELINELHPAIQTTILRSKEALLLQRTALEREYNKYMSRVGDVPEQERILTEIGRDRNIKQGVYVSLLQKREENAMELAKTIDKGRLADATLFNKKVKPRTVIVLALAFLIGLLLPYIFVFLRRWLRGTINDRQDLDGLTSLPVIGEIPSEGSRTEEAFISIRSNLLHQMGADKKTILVTSDTLGDGKTYTAIALAVRALKNREVRRIILSRPAVEAGEKLGFLPGDMKEKIDPYLQPLYDALQDMIPATKLAEYMEKGTIQIAPLAFMRGRTLSDAVVILDEAQNTTALQLKMFLTRLGFGSKMIVTGDMTQIDLPPSQKSGLRDAMERFRDVKGISLITFNERDIVRHPLVKHIVAAYENSKKNDI